jgi:hypothetical protein
MDRSAMRAAGLSQLRRQSDVGLFGARSSITKLGGGAKGTAARKVIENIAGKLELDLQDTPGEYFVLQAAGMLFASNVRAITSFESVRTMDESFDRADLIMTSFHDAPVTDRPILETRARAVYNELEQAAASGVPAGLIVGDLNSYLHYVEGLYLKRKSGNLDLAPFDEMPTKPPSLSLHKRYRVPKPRMSSRRTARPTRLGRFCLWLVFIVLIFFSVAVTNGFVIFFLGVVSSCLLSSWMLTAFLVCRGNRGKSLAPFLKVILVAIGIIGLAGFVYGHPLYVGTVLAVVIYEMRVLNRYDLGPIAAIASPVVSILPIVPISHATYARLVLFTQTSAVEPIFGYLLVGILFVSAIMLIKKDDARLLPLVGKTEEEFAFENVGVPKWLRRRFGA